HGCAHAVTHPPIASHPSPAAKANRREGPLLRKAQLRGQTPKPLTLLRRGNDPTPEHLPPHILHDGFWAQLPESAHCCPIVKLDRHRPFQRKRPHLEPKVAPLQPVEGPWQRAPLRLQRIAAQHILPKVGSPITVGIVPGL